MTALSTTQWVVPLTIACLQSLILVSEAFSSSTVWKNKQRPLVGTALGVSSDLDHLPTSINETQDNVGTLEPIPNEDICTVQILMSDTGGGHRASAIALQDALETLYPGQFECDIVDIFTEYGPFWPFNDFVQMYKLMAEHPWSWDLVYKSGETDFGLEFNKVTQEAFCYEPFQKCLARTFASTQKRADIVVSVHPLCQDLPLKILSNLDSDQEKDNDGLFFGMEDIFGMDKGPSSRTTPFVTVVTDLGGAHKTWFNPDVDKCFVPSDALNEKAQARGLDSSQIVQHGLPIRKGFWPKEIISNSTESSTAMQDKNIRAIRKQLEMDDLPTVLVVGGGDGMGGIVDIAFALGNSLGDETTSSKDPKYQMVVVCGSNKEAQQELRSTKWPNGVKVNVQGYVTNMDAWMKASDCLVTKAGPGTIAEASICGLPCLLFAYLPGQEEGNVPFVEGSGFGKYSSDPREIAENVSSWLKSPQKMESMKKASLAAARPTATLDIAREVAEIALKRKKMNKLRP